ncbi:MAG: DUF4837 family protein [Melioribacteraceae bacterium]|nr:DUF4837 family protein [Melioribacteraceae bacterium]
MNISKLLVVAFVAIQLFSTGCGENKNRAIGNEDDIYIVADSVEFAEIEGALLTVFGKIIYTPQSESMFNLIRKNYSDLEKVKKYKNVIIAAPINSGSLTSKYINSVLSKDVIKLVQEDSTSIINKNDLWSRDQLVMFISASSIEKLSQIILNNHENLIYYFQKASDTRLKKSLYNPTYEDKLVEAKLLKSYDWLIYVQTDFKLALDKPEDNFVWLRRSPGSDMERWIFVHWIENSSPALLNSDSINAIRNRMTEKYYTTSNDSAYVEITNDFRTSKEVNFNNKYAIMTQGLWNMSDGSMGGPFISYTFYDEASKRLYMVDGSIYAPKYYKKLLIQQVDVILKSFLTGKEVTKDQREMLFDELE